MRFLKFDIYEGGHIGFFNSLMSLELGVGLSVLSNRRLLLNVPPHPIFNSEKQLNLLDLVELFFPHQAGCFANLEGEFLPDLHCCRISATDLLDFDQATVLCTRNSHTLGYYSYVLPFDERVIYACNHLIAVKEPYRRVATSIVNELRRQYGRFASVHIRRGDFVNVHNQTASVTLEEMRYNIGCHVSPDCFLLIHSDEMDPDYFGPLLEVFPRHCLIDVALFRELYPHSLDTAEIGLVSALIASQSDIFLGTMFSTFTGYIQRKRLLNGMNGGFLYLYNQRPDSLAFRDGEILESGTSGPTWERVEMSDDLKSICFWWREWPESVPRAYLHPRLQLS
jgi:GDP-fucose protein O-fucosyltransferase